MYCKNANKRTRYFLNTAVLTKRSLITQFHGIDRSMIPELDCGCRIA